MKYDEKFSLSCRQIVLAVTLRNSSPIAIGLASPELLGRAIRRAADSRSAIEGGSDPSAMAEQAENRPSHVIRLSSNSRMCSKRQPEGPGLDPHGYRRTVEKKCVLERLIGSLFGFGASSKLLVLLGCFAANFEIVSSDAGARPELVKTRAAREISPTFIRFRAVFLAHSC